MGSELPARAGAGARIRVVTMQFLPRFVAHPAGQVDVALALLCVIIGVAMGVWPGQDANWDLRNYHFYNPQAWLTGRALIDIAPAQLQTWHAPLADIPYYLLMHRGWHSGFATAVLSLPAALALYFVAKIAARLADQPLSGLPLLALLAAVAAGAVAFPWTGTTMSEWHVAAPLLAAVWLVLGLAAEGSGDRGRVLMAGALGGLAVGLKLTGAAYCIGLAAMLLAMPGSPFLRVRRLAVLAFGGVTAALLVYGPWGLHLYSAHGNPLFPYWNNVFHAPDLLPLSYADNRYVVRSPAELVSLPWRLMTTTRDVVSETPLRDWRIGIGLPAALALAVGLAARQTRPRWRGLAVFLLVSYVLWAVLHGIYRYALVLETLCAMAAWSFAVHVVPRHRALAALICLALLVAATRWPAMERIPHGESTVVLRLPPLPAQSMVALAGHEPLGYIAANLPPDVPAISLVNNLTRQGQSFPLQERALARVRGHDGPVWLLVNIDQAKVVRPFDPTTAAFLAQQSITIDDTACLPFATKLEWLAFCPVRMGALR